MADEAKEARSQKYLASHLRRQLARSVPPDLLADISDEVLIARYHEHHQLKLKMIYENSSQKEPNE
jgi:hypothetical protein